MSNVNGNNIDDLFKRASDQYPLRTNSSDWNKLAADLEKDPSLILPPLNEEDGKRKRRRFFWFFLLLPLGGAGYYAWHSTTESHRQTLVKIESKDPVIQSGAGKKVVEEPSSGKPGNEIRTQEAQPDGKSPDQPEDKSPEGKSRNLRNDQGYVGKSVTNSLNSNQTREKFIRIRSTHNGSSVPEKRKGYGDAGSDRMTSTEAGVPHETGSTGAARHETGLTGTATHRTGSSGVSQQEVQAPGSKLNVQRASMVQPFSLTVSVKNNGSANSLIKDSGTTRHPQKNNTKKSSFYAGVLVAPDLSLVKFQSIKGVGTTYGALLGYNINKKWAIESGLYVERKKYYTDGKYFTLKNPGLPPSGSELVDVDGVCNMLELPINVRYNLGAGPKMHWFATGGFSTYFMSSENYTYKYQYISGGSTWDRSWGSKKPSQYWFSVFNLSLGYEQRLGKIGDLRLEPYLRVPLSGIGTGSLPIMSAGLNIGITRKFR